MNTNWIDLDWKGQRLYLPTYTKLFRNTERIITDSLLSMGFEECLFPKLFTEKQGRELKTALPRLTKEWSKELVESNIENLEGGYPSNFILPHWQCEPFYYFLQKEKPQNTIKFFDKSGWSYRVENDINDFRLFEFQRTECVWACPKEEAEKILDELLNNLSVILAKLGLKNKIVEKKNEEQESSEKTVKDIEVEIKDGKNIELIGSHIHGRLFIEGLDIEIPKNFYTGCCGIGMSRIVNCLTINST